MGNIKQCFDIATTTAADGTNIGKCSAEVAVIFFSFVTLLFFLLILFTFYQKKTSWKSMLQIRTFIFIFCSLGMLDSMVHYLVMENEVWI